MGPGAVAADGSGPWVPQDRPATANLPPMTQKRQLPYGSWPSPISIEMAVAGSRSVREPRFDGEHLYWTEGRPAERGRQVVVRWSPATGVEDVTPAPFYARTMVHEYGGGAYAVH